MISQPTPPASVPFAMSRTAVPPIATAMPAADSQLPLRAVAGEFMRMRPRTKHAAPMSQARRTRVSRSDIGSGLAGGGGARAVAGDARRSGRTSLGGRGLAAEHLEHAVRDD